MANEKQLIDPNDVYSLFGANGMARLHVGDIDVIPRVDALVLPPIKIGDIAYFVIGGKVYKAEVHFIRWEQHKHYGVHSEISASIIPNYTVGASFDDFGKTVFLTKEEAEAALAKMDGDWE